MANSVSQDWQDNEDTYMAPWYPYGVVTQLDDDLELDEYDIVADQLDTATQATLMEQRKAAGECVKCGTLLPMTWQGLGTCQKGCGK